MSLLGYPLANNLLELTPLQESFLEEALIRVDMRRNGMDPDEHLRDAEGEGKKPSSVPTDSGKPMSLSDYAKKRRQEGSYQEKGT